MRMLCQNEKHQQKHMEMCESTGKYMGEKECEHMFIHVNLSTWLKIALKDAHQSFPRDLA